jgi:hypothetical protein
LIVVSDTWIVRLQRITKHFNCKETSMFQWRPKEIRALERQAMYNPQRDLAYVGRGMLKQAMIAMDEKWWEPWFRQYMSDHGLVYADLVPAAEKWAGVLNDIIRTKDLGESLKEHGFDTLPAPIQAAFYIRMGQVLLAGIWTGVKDVSQPDTAPPADLQDIHDMVKETLQQLLERGVNDESGTSAEHCNSADTETSVASAVDHS